ncbi:phosphatase 2C-like domain-containing protein [Mycena floridula]|nr:phosphatase 2C-like domain-containing protein [Mycena floridula]
MGSTMSMPDVTKTTESGDNARFYYSTSCLQGWRISMEDAHTNILDFDTGETESPTGFFGVYDGHGGAAVAKYAGQNLHKRLLNDELYRAKQYEAALKRTYLGTDEDILADPVISKDSSGCTAVVALLLSSTIYVANAGDSRSIISVKGVAKPLSTDHKPNDEGEKKRIVAAGAFVDMNRVNGNLALSRALGDFGFKANPSLPAEQQVVTSDPDVVCHEIGESDEFLVLACDGIWDCLSSQQVVDIVRLLVAEGKTLNEVSETICELCVAPDTSGGGLGCDNMTVTIVALLQGRTKEEWAAQIKTLVENGHGYPTPKSLPTLYSEQRKAAYRERLTKREAEKIADAQLLPIGTAED